MTVIKSDRLNELLVNRRTFLLTTAFGLVSIPLLPNLIQYFNREAIYLSSSNYDDKGSFITAFDAKGRVHYEIPVGARCHAFAPDPVKDHRIVVFPKRPGYISYVVDFKEAKIIAELRCPEGRFFYGHGCFSPDGRYLFASENDYVTRRGVLSVWDTTSFQRIGEISTFGIGPHDVHVMPDSKTMVVANGGVFEHPDQGGREKLNVDTMQPSLVYVDIASSKLLGEFRPRNSKQGLRHLAIRDDGLVAVAIQSEAPKDVVLPLVAFQSPGKDFVEADCPEHIVKQMDQYALSIAIAATSPVTCVTSPNGNLVVFFDSSTGKYLAHDYVVDPGGASLTSEGDQFIVTTGKGQILRYNLQPGKELHRETIAEEGTRHWDNHISTLLMA